MFFARYIIIVFFFLPGKPHPFYLSVTDIKYNEKNKSLEVACKLFANDLENTLKKLNNKTVDILNPKDKKETEKLIFDYITKHLVISLNGKNRVLKFIGYEKEEDVVWIYMESEKCEKPKQFFVTTTLLYDFLKEQVNIVQVDINGSKQSSKVSNPDKELKFIIN